MRLSLIYKFFFPIFFILLVAGLILYFLLSFLFSDFYLNFVKEFTIQQVEHRVKNILKPEDFIIVPGIKMQLTPALKQILESKQEELMNILKEIKILEIFKVNIWDTNFTIIASSDSQLVGLSSPQNTDLLRAYQDNKVAEIEKSPELETPYGEQKSVLEIYIPIKSADNQIISVIETYHSVAPLFQIINRTTKHLAIIIGGLIFIIGFLIFILMRLFIVKPLKELRKATYPISRGEFSGSIKIKQKDEIGSLAEDFNLMIQGLNDLSSEIARLQEIGKIKSEFISIAAHQLRTPLSGIKWVLEVLKEKNQTAEVKEWLLKINELNERIIKIISDFLNVARIEEGRFGYEFKKINLASILRKAVDLYKVKIENKKLNFVFPSRPLLLAIKGDSEKLEIAFGNLIGNAIDYTQIEGTITVEMEKKDNFAIVRISDTGIGISKEDLEKLFARFFRGKNAALVRPDGSGLGLFVAKNIIEKHGGEIYVESELEKGSSFIVKVPLLGHNFIP